MEKYLKYKKKYILLSGSKPIVRSKSQQKHYHAAGVCIIEKSYNHGRKPGEPAYIFYKSYRGCWEILGGEYDPAKDIGTFAIAETAKRESYEESATYLNFENTGVIGKKVSGIDVMSDQQDTRPGHGTFYRAYFVAIPSGQFLRSEATASLTAYVGQSPYNEMTDVTRVYLSDLEPELGKAGDVTVVDTHGTTITISALTKALIRNAGRASGAIIQAVLANPKKVTKITVGGLKQLVIGD